MFMDYEGYIVRKFFIGFFLFFFIFLVSLYFLFYGLYLLFMGDVINMFFGREGGNVYFIVWKVCLLCIVVVFFVGVFFVVFGVVM